MLKQERKVYFKVVLDTNGLLQSCAFAWGNFSAIVTYLRTYHVGVWVAPHEGAMRAGYGLLVFRKLEQAIKFCIENETPGVIHRIYECEIGKEIPLRPGGPLTLLAAIGRGDQAERSDQTSCLYELDWPRGTVATNALRLTREVSIQRILRCHER